MKFLLLCSLLFSCTPQKPKYFAGQKVTWGRSEAGKFWSKVCENVAIIKGYDADYYENVLYDVEVNCIKLGETGSMHKKFFIYEKQITGVIEE